MNILEFLKKGVGPLLSFEKLVELSIGFRIALRAYKYTSQKSAFFENSN